MVTLITIMHASFTRGLLAVRRLRYRTLVAAFVRTPAPEGASP